MDYTPPVMTLPISQNLGAGLGVESYVSMLRGTNMLSYTDKRGEGVKYPKILLT